MSYKSSSILRGATPLVAALFGVSNLLSALPQVTVQSRTLSPLSYKIQFWGSAEIAYEGRAISPGGTMLPAGEVQTILPGLYQLVDGETAFHPTRIYQLHGEDLGAPPSWLDTYPISPLPGEEVGPLPSFEWQPAVEFVAIQPDQHFPPGGDPNFPFPPEVFYDFHLYEFETDSDGTTLLAHEGVRPILSVGGLTEPNYRFQFSDPVLRPDRHYAYTVSAFVPATAQMFTGRAIPFRSFLSTQTTIDWHKLFELIRQMQEELEHLRSQLNGNPLIQEVRLIEQLLAILQDDKALRDYVVAILQGEFDKLKEKIFSTDTLIDVLEQLQKLLDYYINYDSDLSQAQKNALKFLKDRLDVIIDALETSQDISEAWEDLEALIEEIKNLVSDPVGYLVNLIKDKLVEQLIAQLAKHLGAKAAGAIVSILVDLVNAGSAIITAVQIAALEEEINKLLITAIEAETRTIYPSRLIEFRTHPNEEDCLVTAAYKKKCFKKADGGSRYKGTWEEHDVRMANGATSESEVAENLPVENGKRQFQVDMDPDDLVCPAGQGPCLVYLIFTIECPNGNTRTHKIFIGVINCSK